MTPEVIIENAKCFECIPAGMRWVVLLSLAQEDFMHTFATVTPVDYDIVSAFGYTTNNRNFPGLLGIRFLPVSTIAGYAISGQTSLLSMELVNLTSFPVGALCTFNGNTVLQNLSFNALQSSGVLMQISSTVVPNPALTNLSLPVLVSAAGLTCQATALPLFSCPLLTTMTGTMAVSGNNLLTSISLPLLTTATNLNFGTNAALSSLNLSSVITMTGTLTLTNCTSLPSLSLPSLTTGILSCSGCTVLTSLTLPNWQPANGNTVNFSNCALDQASVDLVLARAVSNAAYVSGTVSLNGGTSATPSAAGLADKATLIGRGCTVNTN